MLDRGSCRANTPLQRYQLLRFCTKELLSLVRSQSRLCPSSADTSGHPRQPHPDFRRPAHAVLAEALRPPAAASKMPALLQQTRSSAGETPANRRNSACCVSVALQHISAAIRLDAATTGTAHFVQPNQNLPSLQNQVAGQLLFSMFLD